MTSSDMSLRHLPISFFNFIKYSQADILQNTIPLCNSILQQRCIKGTLILAEDGYNGQITVPFNTSMDLFHKEMKESLCDQALDFNIGPSFDINNENPPYKKLIVKYKDSIMNDGLEKSKISLSHGTGKELEPEQWHSSIADDPNDKIIIDVRNFYETERGTFKNSVPLNTKTYSDTWDALDSVLANKPKDLPIYTFCTG
jgi:predicted sulfurtransferase